MSKKLALFYSIFRQPENNTPHKNASEPPKICAIKIKMPRDKWSLLSHCAVNVEKVVKLPRKPVMINNRQNSVNFRLIKNPIKKQPTILAIHVPKGSE